MSWLALEICPASTHTHPCCCAPCWESEAIMDDTGQAINHNERERGNRASGSVRDIHTLCFYSTHTFDSRIDLLPSFVLKHSTQSSSLSLSLSLSLCVLGAAVFLMTESDSWSTAWWLPLIYIYFQLLGLSGWHRRIRSRTTQIHVCSCVPGSCCGITRYERYKLRIVRIAWYKLRIVGNKVLIMR